MKRVIKKSSTQEAEQLTIKEMLNVVATEYHRLSQAHKSLFPNTIAEFLDSWKPFEHYNLRANMQKQQKKLSPDFAVQWVNQCETIIISKYGIETQVNKEIVTWIMDMSMLSLDEKEKMLANKKVR